MKPINKGLLLRYIIINLVITSLILLAIWYSGPFIKGPWFIIKLYLDAPAFIILSIVGGINYAMHFASESIFRLVSFIFYSLVIATAQWILYKRKKKREEKNT